MLRWYLRKDVYQFQKEYVPPGVKRPPKILLRGACFFIPRQLKEFTLCLPPTSSPFELN